VIRKNSPIVTDEEEAGLLSMEALEEVKISRARFINQFVLSFKQMSYLTL
jgi:hypothetical protein